jgi:hypothetical protein
MNPELLARICHEANRAYCESLNDHSQVPWDLTPEWQRESARAGVRFHLVNPHAAPWQSHVEWLRHKNAEGWSYGPVKDAERKLHPCFVPFDQLPASQKAKDHLFAAIVNALRPFLSAHFLESFKSQPM